jgi:hypothetical protein
VIMPISEDHRCNGDPPSSLGSRSAVAMAAGIAEPPCPEVRTKAAVEPTALAGGDIYITLSCRQMRKPLESRKAPTATAHTPALVLKCYICMENNNSRRMLVTLRIISYRRMDDARR